MNEKQENQRRCYLTDYVNFLTGKKEALIMSSEYKLRIEEEGKEFYYEIAGDGDFGTRFINSWTFPRGIYENWVERPFESLGRKFLWAHIERESPYKYWKNEERKLHNQWVEENLPNPIISLPKNLEKVCQKYGIQQRVVFNILQQLNCKNMTLQKKYKKTDISYSALRGSVVNIYEFDIDQTFYLTIGVLPNVNVSANFFFVKKTSSIRKEHQIFNHKRKVLRREYPFVPDILIPELLRLANEDVEKAKRLIEVNLLYQRDGSIFEHSSKKVQEKGRKFLKSLEEIDK